MIISSAVRRQKLRKDPIRCHFGLSKNRGQILTLDLSAATRTAPKWKIGSHFKLIKVDLENKIRLIISPASVNGYRLTTSSKRRAKIIFPMKPKIKGLIGTISEFESRVFGHELFIDIPKSCIEKKAEPFKLPSLFEWANIGKVA